MATRSLRLNYGDGTGPGKVGEILFAPVSPSNDTALWTSTDPARIALKYADETRAPSDPGYSPEYTILGVGKYASVPVTVGATYIVDIIRINQTRDTGLPFQITIPAGASTLNISTLTPTPVPPINPADLVDAAIAYSLTNSPLSKAILAKKLDKPDASALPATVYGNSFTNRSLSTITPGHSYFDLAAPELNLGTITTYGVNGSRGHNILNHLLASGAITGGTTPVAGSVWPGVSARPGVVIIDTETGDIAHGNGSTAVTSITGAGGTRYLAAMENVYVGALALASIENRIEETSNPGTVDYTGSGWNVTGGAYCSGGSYGYTTTPGDAVLYTLSASKIPQEGPLAGRCWLFNLQFDPSQGVTAPVSVSIDGGTAVTITPDLWETQGTETFRNGVIPFTLPVDGAAHTAKFTHVGASGNLMTVDMVGTASSDPGPIFVMGASTPGVSVAGYDSTAIPKWKANRRLLSPRLRAAIAQFPNAIYVPSTMTPNGNSSVDKLHPNDRGMAERGNDLVFAARRELDAYLANRGQSLRPDSDFAAV